MKYNSIYKKYPEYFGSNPDRLLLDHHNKINKELPVLDIGAGQGRNSIFLAEKGFIVDAIDQSTTAVDIIKKFVKKNRLPINTYQCNFENFEPKTSSYSAILIFGVIQELSRSAIESMIHKINIWSGTGSLIFITAFTTQDPDFKNISTSWKKIGGNSFSNDEGEIKTYLKPDEIIGLFKGYSPLYHWEGLGPEHTHSNGSVHRHGRIEVVFQK